MPRLFLALFATACLTATATMTYLVVTRGPGRPARATAASRDITVPPFALVDAEGKTFGSRDLAGKAYVIGFVFTRCRLVCPVMAARMKQLQADWAGRADQIRLVAITVDPEHDTPAVLARYAETLGADPAQWAFLTGPRQDIWTLSEQGFKLPVAEEPENPLMPIGHSSKLVLVDRHGRIFDYYSSIDETDLSRLRRDVETALRLEP